MYKLIIIDDDVGTSNSLSNYFPWETQGFQLMEKFYDGITAFRYLQKHRVDLIISDIKMPEMNGIELARKLHEMHREEKIIFISGYKDFEYARSALEYGVKCYCLKPVTYREINEKLRAIKAELDAERGAREPGNLPESSFDSMRVNKVKTYIAANCRDVTLNRLAEYMDMNASYLSRFFREKTGETVSEYITRVRMQKALELLKKDEFRTLQEVGEQVGYTNPASFTKAFTQLYGVSPSAYRRDFTTLEKDKRR
ncbi:MAG: helix-turn-helix domain-containing protein [Aristaeellaceae bacterium]